MVSQGSYILPYLTNFGLGHMLALTNAICTSSDWKFQKASPSSTCPFVVLSSTWDEQTPGNSCSFSLRPEWETRTDLNPSQSGLVEPEFTRKEMFVSMSHWDLRVVCYAGLLQQNLNNMHAQHGLSSRRFYEEDTAGRRISHREIKCQSYTTNKWWQSD